VKRCNVALNVSKKIVAAEISGAKKYPRNSRMSFRQGKNIKAYSNNFVEQNQDITGEGWYFTYCKNLAICQCILSSSLCLIWLHSSWSTGQASIISPD
jgi:hypothetical protein